MYNSNQITYDFNYNAHSWILISTNDSDKIISNTIERHNKINETLWPQTTSSRLIALFPNPHESLALLSRSQMQRSVAVEIKA